MTGSAHMNPPHDPLSLANDNVDLAQLNAAVQVQAHNNLSTQYPDAYVCFGCLTPWDTNDLIVDDDHIENELEDMWLPGYDGQELTVSGIIAQHCPCPDCDHPILIKVSVAAELRISNWSHEIVELSSVIAHKDEPAGLDVTWPYDGVDDDV